MFPKIPAEDIIIPTGDGKSQILKYLTPQNIGYVLAFLLVAVLLWKVYTSLPKWVVVVLVVLGLGAIGAISYNVQS